MSKKKSKNLAGAVFQVGDKVRVKHGFMDLDYPDMPLGGWTGIVENPRGRHVYRPMEQANDGIDPSGLQATLRDRRS